MNMGTLLIIETGNAVFGEDGYETKNENSEFLNTLINSLGLDDWRLLDTVFVGIHYFYDSTHRGNINRLFCNKVFKSLEEGANIIIVVKYANMVSKRLRDKAIILTLPNASSKE